MSVWRNDRNYKYMFIFLLKVLARNELKTLIENSLKCGLFFSSVVLVAVSKAE